MGLESEDDPEVAPRPSDTPSDGEAPPDCSSDVHDGAPLLPLDASDGAKAAAPVQPTALTRAYFARVAAPLASWLACSVSLILYNKWLFIGAFPHPLTLVAVHMLFASAVTFVMTVSGHLTVPSLGWSRYATTIVPIAGAFACSLSMSNLAAVRLTVSFIQMVKAVTPMMTFTVTVIAGTERFRWSLVAICAAMTLGVGIASAGEVSLDAIGLTLQLASIALEAVRHVAVQRLVQVHLPKPSNPLVALALFAPPCAALLLPVALTVEPGALASLALPSRGAAVFGNAIVALALNFSIVWLVSQESGPLTLTLAGIVKDVALIASSVALFGNPIAPVQVGGYAIALYGLNCYHVYRTAPPDAPPPFLHLVRTAATDRSALLTALCVLGLCAIATW